jgi:fermentation-respiration switch protein FrsA (DUF1100 family)
MHTAAHEYPKTITLVVTNRWITADFSDGSQLGLTLARAWRLERAAPARHARRELVGDRRGVRRPETGEDLGAHGFFVGAPAPRPRGRSS